jgi:CO/xanthine dehydrogenase Mo-binding subunit
MAGVGQSVPRVDGLEKVTGRVEYTINMEIPGMLHVKVLRSPHPHARIVAIDASRAERFRGVRAVLTREDLKSSRVDPYYGPVVRDQPIVAIDRVRYVGDVVAAVAAVDEQVAEEALELIAVEYEELPAVLDVAEAMRPGAPLLHESVRAADVAFADMRALNLGEGRSNVVSHFRLRRGDVDEGFRQSDEIFEDEFVVPAIQHLNMEPHAALAMVHPDGRIEVWSSTQNPSVIREQLAEVFRVDLSRIRVAAPYVGGGYGGKTYPKLEPLVVAMAMKARRPVKLVLTREEVFYTVTRHAVRTRIKTGVKRDGTLVARRCELLFDTGAYADIGPRTSKNTGYAAGGPYRIPHVAFDSYCVYTNKPPAGAFRGFGVPQVCWAYEQQMDMIAERLGLDPLELRLRNALDEGDAFFTGETLHAVPVKECLRKVAAAIRWGSPSQPAPPGRVRAKGLAAMIKSTMTPTVSAATMKMEEDGSVSILTGTVEIGQGSDTVLAQIAAEILSLPVERIRVTHSDTSVTPYDQSTSSSRSTFSMGNAVRLASLEIREQLIAIVAKLLEISPDDLECRDGRVIPRGSPERAVSYADVIRQHFGMAVGSIMGRGTWTTTGHLDPQTGQGKASAFWFTSAVGCEVEVDTETGQVDVLALASAVNAGKALNPRLCEGQIEGSLFFGLGATFYEEMLYEDGQLINPNLLDYRLPTTADLPGTMVPILVESPHREGPLGAIGIGESAVAPVAPAIGNAIARAVGEHVKALPITAEKVLQILRRREPAER